MVLKKKERIRNADGTQITALLSPTCGKRGGQPGGRRKRKSIAGEEIPLSRPYIIPAVSLWLSSPAAKRQIGDHMPIKSFSSNHPDAQQSVSSFFLTKIHLSFFLSTSPSLSPFFELSFSYTFHFTLFRIFTQPQVSLIRFVKKKKRSQSILRCTEWKAKLWTVR